MKNILIMGAGVYQVPLIKKAKEMGHKSIVVSPQGNYPGLTLADEVISLDTRNHVEILKEAKRIGIDAALTTGTDVAVPTIGYLVDELGLAGTGYAAAKRSMDKVAMKQCFSENSVQTAKFQVVESLDGLKKSAASIGFPLMVKAVDSSGSRGITQVLSFDGLESAFQNAKSVSKSPQVIVEQFLSGVEIGAQAVVIGGDVVEVFLHSDDVTPPPVSAPIGHAMPLDIEGVTALRIKSLVSRAVKSLGIRDTISNVDLMIVDGEPYVLEIGARMGATCLAENISVYGGFDAYEFILKLALSEKTELPKIYEKQANAALLLRAKKSGKITKITVPESTKNHPNLIQLMFDYQEGDRVNAFRVGPDRIGHLLVKGASYEEAIALVKNLASTITFDIEESKTIE